jgi:hypothetical protein
MTKQEFKLAAKTERPPKSVPQEKNTLYQVKAQVLSAPFQAPVRHQHFTHVQQYYTGDA